MQQHQATGIISPVLSLSPSSPSFSSYSSSSPNLTQIAARVVQESTQSHDRCFSFGSDNDIFDWKSSDPATAPESCCEAEEFEFAVVLNSGNDNEKRESEDYNAADEIFFNRQIKPLYPLFGRDLFVFHDNQGSDHGGENKPKRLPLGKLMREDTLTESETASSSVSRSSSDSESADDLDNLHPGTFCVWTPKESSPTAERSNSMGTRCKGWNKLRDFLHRSNSDCKVTFPFSNHRHNHNPKKTSNSS